MKIHSLIHPITALAAIACLGLAYLQAGDWWILPIFFVMALFWISLKKRSVFWRASALLLIYVFLAGVGLAAHLPLVLIGIGCTCAVACWDLIEFRQGMIGNQPLKTHSSLEKHHMQSLALAAFLGPVLVLISSYVDLQIPFVVTVLLVLIAVGGLAYGLHFSAD